MKNLPEVDVFDSEQNAFVQDWLTAFNRAHGYEEDIEATIEHVQETYDYKDHMKRTNATINQLGGDK